MASTKIPKFYQGGIAKILAMPEEQFQALIANLQRAPFSFELTSSLRNAVRAVEGIQLEDVSPIADALFSLYAGGAASDKSTTEFIEGFPQGIKESLSEELINAGESGERVVSRLRQLFEVNSFALATKASSVMFEYDRVFFKARVLTDIRPVFGDGAEEAKAMILIHNLRIHYHKGEDHEDFSVALDAKDIQKLIDTLERAKVKAETLKGILAAANVPYIEPE